MGRIGPTGNVMMARRFRRVLAAALLAALSACSVLEPLFFPKPAPAEPAAPPATLSAELFLVAHPGVELPAAQARDLFLGEAPERSPALVPVDNTEAQADFLKRVLRLGHEQYDKLWSRKAYRDGREPPARLAGDAAVLDFVRRTPGAVGYVRRPGPRVKVIGKLR